MAKKTKKRKLNWKRVFKVLFILIAIPLIIYLIINLRIKRIIIIGTNNLTDLEIINKANIKDYPKLKDLKLSDIKNSLYELELVDNVEVKLNIFRNLIITIKEASPLYYDLDGKLVLDNGKKIADDSTYLGLPVLINNIPSSVEEEFILKLKDLNKDVLSMINEIEYNPSLSKDGKYIDDKRFIFYMNDGNQAIVNPVNLEKFNNYVKILDTTINTMGENVKGQFHFDTATNRVTFASFESLKTEEESDIDETES